MVVLNNFYFLKLTISIDNDWLLKSESHLISLNLLQSCYWKECGIKKKSLEKQGKCKKKKKKNYINLFLDWRNVDFFNSCKKKIIIVVMFFLCAFF